MSILQFAWVGDLDENKTQRLQNSQALFQERCHPMVMVVRQDKKETRIGRKNSKMPPDYTLESAVSNRMISRNHVTIERLSKGNYMLYDHSLNGTYVNYCRVIGGTILKNEDVVCFGHINGANIKPGESVTPFSTDLKYRVEIMELSTDRPGTRREHLSESSEEESAARLHTRFPQESRKKVRPPSERSDHSSDSSEVSRGNEMNNYSKRKKASSSSSDCDERLKQPHKDRPTHKKPFQEKPKKHSSLLVSGRHIDQSRKRKVGPEVMPPRASAFQKKPHDVKRSRPDDDRRMKEMRKLHSGHKSHQKSKHADIKPAKRSNAVNSNYDYEECSAQPCLRPDGENLIDWIMCDKCNQWFHQFCVGLDEAVDADESYYCPYCANE